MNEITTVFIILNYKTYKDTLVLVDSLLEQGLGNRRIIIIDNASPNESFEILNDKYGRNDKVDVIYSEKNGGFSKGNNIGLRFAKKYSPKYACVINNDVRFLISTIFYIEQIYATIPNAGILAPRQIKPDGADVGFLRLNAPTFWSDFLYYIPGYIKLFGRKHRYVQNTKIRGVQKVGFIPGAFLFLDYELFESCGFFEELTFLFCEERIICKKIHNLKLGNYIVFSHTYIHDHSTTINKEKSLKQQNRMIFDGICIYTQHFRKNAKIKVLLLKVIYQFRQLFYKIVNSCCR